MIFDEKYFKGDGYGDYINYPHFHQRAQWILQNLSGDILEIGCAHGYLMKELQTLGVIIDGVDKSSYVDSKSVVEVKGNILIADIKDVFLATNQYDWIISWNVLDCLDDVSAQEIADILNSGGVNQLHVVLMSEKNNDYTKQGYFIRDYDYWRGLLPNAILVRYEDGKVFNPTGENFSKIPLCWGEVSE